MKNIPLLVGTIIASVLLVVAISVGFSSKTEEELATETVNPEIVAGDRRHTKGASESAVTIVEFSDFQCPACKAVEPLVAELMTTYGDRVELVYRHMPLDSIHPNARLAAQAAETAAQHDKFWEMHQRLFEKQTEWSEITDREELITTFAEYAEGMAISREEFLESIESKEVKDAVQGDVTTAVASGLQGTPTFFVNGTKTAAQQLERTVQSQLGE